jgi:hypothetical protein
LREWAARFRDSVGGLPPEQLALLISVGLVFGVFPISGCPTLLCLLAGFVLRLNVPALQLLNNISSPLQLALLFPLARAGAWVCGGSASAGSALSRFETAALHAVTGWACLCIPSGVLFYFVLIFSMRKCRRACSNSVKSACG